MLQLRGLLAIGCSTPGACLICHLFAVLFFCVQANNGSEVASLASLLLAVGRYNSLEAAYIASRLPLITAMWEEAAAMLASSSSAAAAGPAGAAAVAAGGASSGGVAGGWLLLLYNNLLGLLEGDAAWLGGCLQQQRQQLLMALMGAAFDKVSTILAVTCCAFWLLDVAARERVGQCVCSNGCIHCASVGTLALTQM